MKTFLFTLCVYVFAFCQMSIASNKDIQIYNQTATSSNEPYIRIADYYPGIITIYAYIENKPEGTNFRWFIDGDGWQCLYQYPDDEGAAFDYLGSEATSTNPRWIWLEYIDTDGRNQRIFYQFQF